MFFEFGSTEVFILLVAIVFTAFGYYTGRSNGIVTGGSAMIDMLEDHGFLKVKSRRTDEDGNAITEYSKVDE